MKIRLKTIFPFACIILASFLFFTPAKAEIKKIFDFKKEGSFDTAEAVKVEKGVLSRDGKNSIFVANYLGSYYVITNGKKSERFNYISTSGDLFKNPQFSPNFKRVAYVGTQSNSKNETGEYAVVDNKKSKAYKYISDFQFSPTSKSYAFVATKFNDDKLYIVLNNKESKGYDGINSFEFGPNSERLIIYAYKKMKNPPNDGGADAETFVIDNGKEMGPYYLNSAENYVFSPDSKFFAFIANKNSKTCLIINGKEIKCSYAIEYFNFSPDYKQTVFISTDNGTDGRGGYQGHVVVNGKEGKVFIYDFIEGFAFSPDFKQFAVVIRKDGENYVIINDKKSGPYQSIKNLIFEPKLKKFSFCGIIGSGEANIVIDGKKTATSCLIQVVKGSQKAAWLDVGNNQKIVSFPKEQANRTYNRNDIDENSLITSPDFKQFAFIAQQDDKRFVVLDDNDMGLYNSVDSLMFSPNSKQFIFIAREESGSMVVTNGIERESYNHVNNLIFSPDSKQFIYVAGKDDGKEVIISNNKEESATYDKISNPFFSPNSKHFVYEAVKKENKCSTIKWPEEYGGKEEEICSEYENKYVVLDGKEVGYNLVSSPIITPGSKQLVYAFQSPKDGAIYVNKINLK